MSRSRDLLVWYHLLSLNDQRHVAILRSFDNFLRSLQARVVQLFLELFFPIITVQDIGSAGVEAGTVDSPSESLPS
jgi:hypothetical protein